MRASLLLFLVMSTGFPACGGEGPSSPEGRLDISSALLKGDTDVRLRLLASIQSAELFDARLQRGIVACLGDSSTGVRMLAAEKAAAFNCPHRDTVRQMVASLLDGDKVLHEWISEALWAMYVPEDLLLNVLETSLEQRRGDIPAREAAAEIVALRNGGVSPTTTSEVVGIWTAICTLRVEPTNDRACRLLRSHGLQNEDPLAREQAAIELWVVRGEASGWDAIETAIRYGTPSARLCRVIQYGLSGEHSSTTLGILGEMFELRLDQGISDLESLLLSVLSRRVTDSSEQALGIEWAGRMAVALPTPSMEFLASIRAAASGADAPPAVVHVDGIWRRRGESCR